MTRLRLLTLNAWSIPWGVSEDVRPRMRAIGRRLPDFAADVVVFQEVWTQHAAAALLRAARRAGDRSWWHHERASGLLMLSQVPVRSLRFHLYTLNGLPHRPHHLDYYGNKGILQLDLETAAGPIAVLTTHLHAQHSNSGDDLDYLGHRAAQVVELAGILSGLAQPVVVLGDFNLHEESAHYAALTGLTGLVDSAAALGRRQDTIEFSNPYRQRGHQPGRRIDYVFSRDGHEVAMRPRAIRRVLHEPIEIEGRVAAYSDHAGLLAEVDVGGTSAGAHRPSPIAAEVARSLLRAGSEQALRRGHEEQNWAVSGAVACTAALAARRGVASRRRFLRASMLGMAAMGLAGCAGMTHFSGDFVSRELSGYQKVVDVLDRLDRAGA